MGVLPGNLADSLILSNDTSGYLFAKDLACQFFNVAIDLGIPGPFAPFCSYEKIDLYLDATLRNRAIGSEIKDHMHRSGFPAFGINYLPINNGNQVLYFQEDYERIAVQLRDSLNTNFQLAQDSFVAVFVENPAATSGQLEVYYDDGNTPVEYVDFTIRVLDSLDRKEIPDAQLSLVGGQISKLRGGSYQIRLEKPLPSSISVMVSKGNIQKRVQIAIKEAQSRLPDVLFDPQRKIVIRGRVMDGRQPAVGADIYLNGPNLNINLRTDPNGNFQFSLSRDLAQPSMDLAIFYQKQEMLQNIRPFEQVDGYLFNFNDTPSSNADQVIQTKEKLELIDPRDGQKYPLVKINNQIWMAKNLNYQTSGSWCYLDLPELCTRAGRLYTWEAAQKACPQGFHLPSQEEVDALIKFAETKAGTKVERFLENGDLGFNALLGGYAENGEFKGINNFGRYWATVPNQGSTVHYIEFSNNDQVGFGTTYSETWTLYCRCLKDN